MTRSPETLNELIQCLTEGLDESVETTDTVLILYADEATNELLKDLMEKKEEAWQYRDLSK